jgi:hypothetical protein
MTTLHKTWFKKTKNKKQKKNAQLPGNVTKIILLTLLLLLLLLLYVSETTLHFF